MNSTDYGIPNVIATPTLGKIVRHAGIAGQYALSVSVAYPGERASVVTFTSSTFGGPIVATFPGIGETFISSDVLDRIGHKLSPEWVRAFFA